MQDGPAHTDSDLTPFSITIIIHVPFNAVISLTGIYPKSILGVKPNAEHYPDCTTGNNKRPKH